VGPLGGGLGAGPLLPQNVARLTPQNHAPPHKCYRGKFDCSRSNHMNRGSPKIEGGGRYVSAALECRPMACLTLEINTNLWNSLLCVIDDFSINK